MSPVNKIFDFSFAPTEYADKLFKKKRSIEGRCFLLVQAITSFLAIPVILLVGLIEIAIKSTFLTGGKQTLTNTAAALGVSLLLIPESIVGVIIGEIL